MFVRGDARMWLDALRLTELPDPHRNPPALGLKSQARQILDGEASVVRRSAEFGVEYGVRYRTSWTVERDRYLVCADMCGPAAGVAEVNP